jgi:hypothetical protein
MASSSDVTQRPAAGVRPAATDFSRMFGAKSIEHDGRSMKATLTAQESG